MMKKIGVSKGMTRNSAGGGKQGAELPQEMQVRSD
jgi:hypothetical protein